MVLLFPTLTAEFKRPSANDLVVVANTGGEVTDAVRQLPTFVLPECDRCVAQSRCNCARLGALGEGHVETLTACGRTGLVPAGVCKVERPSCRDRTSVLARRDGTVEDSNRLGRACLGPRPTAKLPTVLWQAVPPPALMPLIDAQLAFAVPAVPNASYRQRSATPLRPAVHPRQAGACSFP